MPKKNNRPNPHSKYYLKSKDGYIISCEEVLKLKYKLPLAFYRLDIARASELYNTLCAFGKPAFIELCKEYELPTEGI